MAIREDGLVRFAKAMKSGDLSKLSQAELQKFDHLNIADDLIRMYGPGKSTAVMLQTRVKERYEIHLHLHTCYKYIEEAQILFNTRHNLHKSYWKGFVVEEIVSTINDINRSLWANPTEEDLKKDPNAAPTFCPDEKLLKTKAKFLELLKDTLRLDIDDAPIDPEDDADIIFLTGNPEDIGLSAHVELGEDLEQRLLQLGAKKDENGNWI